MHIRHERLSNFLLLGLAIFLAAIRAFCGDFPRSLKEVNATYANGLDESRDRIRSGLQHPVFLSALDESATQARARLLDAFIVFALGPGTDEDLALARSYIDTGGYGWERAVSCYVKWTGERAAQRGEPFRLDHRLLQIDDLFHMQLCAEITQAMEYHRPNQWRDELAQWGEKILTETNLPLEPYLPYDGRNDIHPTVVGMVDIIRALTRTDRESDVLLARKLVDRITAAYPDSEKATFVYRILTWACPGMFVNNRLVPSGAEQFPAGWVLAATTSENMATRREVLIPRGAGPGENADGTKLGQATEDNPILNRNLAITTAVALSVSALAIYEFRRRAAKNGP